jgi:hypothetical protein
MPTLFEGLTAQEAKDRAIEMLELGASQVQLTREGEDNYTLTVLS